MKNKTVIRESQNGWVVYFGNDPDNFYVFKSNEPERLVKFLCEHVADIKLDQVLAVRQEEIRQAREQLS